MFTGSCVALVTPMTEDGTLDEQALKNLVEWQISEGTDAMVVSGTTGECPTVTDDELFNMIALVVETVGGKVPVIAGTGSNSTQGAIQKSLKAKE